MNVDLLIDSLVRQTTVLIAQLSTAAGGRAPLAHIANQVFLDLVRELKEQGLGQKVIADMFGLALRTYHAKVQRLSESRTYGGRSLWEAVLEYVQDKETVLRAEVLQRFRNDDPATLRAILKDLVDSSLLFRSGQGERALYRAATAEDVRMSNQSQGSDSLIAFVWVALNRYAPITCAELARVIPLDQERVETALATLVSDGRVIVQSDGGTPRYSCESCVIPYGSSEGWEAAVFDHFQAMVTALCTKVRKGKTLATRSDWVGGSTYTFEIWPGHPYRDKVLGILADSRERIGNLRKLVDDYNHDHLLDATQTERVIAYLGQAMVESYDSGETE